MTHLDAWLSNRNPSTARSYRRAVEDWRAWLGANDPARASQRDASTWAAHLACNHRPATVAARLVAVASFHDYLVGQGLARANPFTGIQRPAVARYGASQPLTVAQLRRLHAALDGPARPDTDHPSLRQLRDRALISFLLHTGRRPSEIAGLRWIDLAPDPVAGCTLSWIDRGRRRAQPLPDRCHAALVSWHTAAGWPIQADGYLWRRSRVAQCTNLPSVAGNVEATGPVTPAQISAIVRRIGRAAGLDLTPAILRHTFSAIYAAGVGDVDELSRLLGHESTAITGAYLRSPSLRATVTEFSAALRALTTP